MSNVVPHQEEWDSASELSCLEQGFDDAKDPFCAVDAGTGSLVWCNRAFRSRAGKTEEALVGLKLADLVDPESTESVASLLETVRSQGAASSPSLRLRGSDGHGFQVAARVSAARDSQGTVRLARFALRDLNPAVQPSKPHVQARPAPADLLERQTLFTGGIAHDFHNILGSVQRGADEALLQISPESTSWPALREIQLAARRGAALADQMLAYSGRGGFRFEPADLNSLVEEMTLLLRATSRPGVDIDLERSAAATTVQADVGRIRQVILDLISRGVQAVEPGPGRVSVRTGSSVLSAEQLGQLLHAPRAEPGEFGWFEVVDTGRPMGPEAIEHMFDPPYMLRDRARWTGPQGERIWGLGLAPILGTIDGCHGAIGVTSSPEATRVQILLPRSAAAASPAPRGLERSEAARPRDRERRSARRGLVLLADDGEHVRAVLQRMLVRAGYGVVTAVDGQEALELYRERSAEIHLVLLDVSMPRMGGQQALEEIIGFNPAAQVILMSGYAEVELEGAEHGGLHVGFLRKPFGMNSLLAMVSEFVPAAS